MSKITLNDITGGYMTAIAYNANNALIEAAFENTLSRAGTTPNGMNADIDMNSNSLLNVDDILAGGQITAQTFILNGTVITTQTTLAGALDAVSVSFTPSGGSLTTLQDALDDDYLRNDRAETVGILTGPEFIGDFTGDLTGDVLTASQTAITQVGTLVDLTVTGSITQGGTQALRSKVFEIGDWNMDTTIFVLPAHDLTLSTIRAISVLIRNDDDDKYYDFSMDDPNGVTQTAHISARDTFFSMTRSNGSVFDGTDFDSTSYNRGWITVWYV